MRVLPWIFALSINAWAHPVSYKGATSVMTWNQPFLSDHWITYSFRPDTAIAARVMRMQMKEGRADYAGVQLDYLLKRWNHQNYQANVYLFGGGGNVQTQGRSGSASLVGAEADIEDRRYFALLKAETMQPSLGEVFNHIEARLGIAPYEAEYDELASWFMIQGQWHPDLEKQFVVTPLVRIFYRSFMLETGVSLDADWMMNLMFHF